MQAVDLCGSRKRGFCPDFFLPSCAEAYRVFKTPHLIVLPDCEAV